MSFNMTKLKKKYENLVQTTVKKATTKAIPIIKQEATKAIAKSTDEKLDTLFDFLSVAIVGIAIVSSKGTITASDSAATQASTYIHIEHLTINLNH